MHDKQTTAPNPPASAVEFELNLLELNGNFWKLLAWKKSREFTHLTPTDRDEIFLLRAKGYKQKDIAIALKRVPSCISYEFKKNKNRDGYDPRKATAKAKERRRNASFRGKKIVRDSKARSFIENALEDGQSPEAISGRLKAKEKHLPDISGDTIERYLKSPYGKLIELPWKKQKYRRRASKKGNLSDRKFIEMRPKQAEKRLRVGDCEGDFIVSGKSGKGVLLVVVCRKLRVAFLENIFPVTVDAVHAAFLRIQERFPEMRTLTLDNDILFQMHLVLEKLLGLKIYFCHPYHSWEKGSVENANRYIRKFLPKGTDLSRVHKKEIQEIEKHLNNRWMECLGHASPAEELIAYRKKRKNSSSKLRERSKL